MLEIGVFNMGKVPLYGYIDTIIPRSLLEEGPVVAGVPRPSGEMLPAGLDGQALGRSWSDDWDEVRGKSELVSGLVRTGFRDTFFKEVHLPPRIAERLVDFEAGLRLAGLVGPDEVLVQQVNRPPKFRVQKAKVRNDPGQSVSPYLDRSERAINRAVVNEGQEKATTPIKRGRPGVQPSGCASSPPKAGT